MSDVIVVNCEGKCNDTGDAIFRAEGSSTESTLAATNAAKKKLEIICTFKGGVNEPSVVCSIRETFMPEHLFPEEDIGDGNECLDIGGVEVVLPRAFADSLKQGDLVTFSDEIEILDRLLKEAISPQPSNIFLINDEIEEITPVGLSLTANVFELSGARWTKKKRIRRVPTGQTRIRWQGIHSRVERKYKEVYFYSEPLDVNNNSVFFNASQNSTVENFLLCVVGLSIVLYLGVQFGIYEPQSFALILGACGTLVGINELGLFEVKGAWA